MLIFRDTCDIYRRSTTGQAYGSTPTYPSTPTLTAVPFQLVTKTQKGFNSVTAEWVTTTTYSGFFPSSQDVREGDRVTNVILDANGEATALANDAGTSYVLQVDGGSINRRGPVASLRKVSLMKVS